MKVATMSSLVLTTASLVGAQAFGAEVGFNNHLKSSVMVSPAQLYQVRHTKTDFQLGFENESAEVKPDGANKLKGDSSSTNLFAAGIYSMDALRAGLSLDYTTGKFKDNDGTTTTKYDETELHLVPQAAYLVGPVAIGVALNVTQESQKAKGGTEAKADYIRPSVGVAYTQEALEAGLAFNSQVKKNENASDPKDKLVEVPAEIILHGRAGFAGNMAAGAILTNRAWKGIDSDRYKDQTAIKGTWEMATGPVKTEAELGYGTAYYKDKTNATPNTIAAYTIGAGADYAVTETAEVGANVAYETGSEKAGGKKLTKNDLNVAIRGNVRF